MNKYVRLLLFGYLKIHSPYCKIRNVNVSVGTHLKQVCA